MDAQEAHRSRPVQWMGRAGMVCYGLVYVVLAYIAAQVALGSQREADHSGALSELASTGLGSALMWVLAVGLFAFALWQALMAAVGYRWIDKAGKRTRKRLGAVVRAGTGISLGIASVRIASGGAAGSGDQKQKELTAQVMALPAGRFIVGAVALVVIVVGVSRVVSGIRGSFMHDLNAGELPTGTRKWVKRLGRVGYIAKGIAIAIIGGLLGVAAIYTDPDEAGGFDAALRTLAAQPFGMTLLLVMAAGFAAFGVYCFAAARAYRT